MLPTFFLDESEPGPDLHSEISTLGPLDCAKEPPSEPCADLSLYRDTIFVNAQLTFTPVCSAPPNS